VRRSKALRPTPRAGPRDRTGAFEDGAGLTGTILALAHDSHESLARIDSVLEDRVFALLEDVRSAGQPPDRGESDHQDDATESDAAGVLP
jgi:hypothetical protein